MLNWRGGEGAGIGHYTFLMVKNLLKIDKKNEYILFLDQRVNNQIQKECIGDNPNASIRNFPFRNAGRALPFVYSHMVLSAAFEKAELDVLHAPANSLPMFYRGASVVTVHDLAIYDHPEWFPSPYPKSLGFSERIIVPYSVNQARRIIAVSNQTKADLIRVFGLPKEKIDVVYEGAGTPKAREDDEVVMRKLGLSSKKYFLFLGTLEPRKNIPTAIRAFARFVQEDTKNRAQYGFIIAGRRGWKYGPILESITKANEDLNKVCGDQEPIERVRHVGYVKREDKAAILKNAIAFVFLSYYEGFGLPVMEAMSLGVPVIASNKASLPEICGDACIMVEPEDQPAVASAMKRLVADQGYVSELAEKGTIQSGKFKWKDAAAKTLNVYEAAFKTPSSDVNDIALDRIWGL